jgi:hypothetical protein
MSQNPAGVNVVFKLEKDRYLAELKAMRAEAAKTLSDVGAVDDGSCA